MHDDALDFLVFIIVLALVTALCFNLTIPIAKKAKEAYYTEKYDKTVGKLEGDKAEDNFDGCMSKEEIMLLAMGQTYFIPEPGKLFIVDTEINITNNIAFSPHSADVAKQVEVALNCWFSKFSGSETSDKFLNPPTSVSNGRYKIMFDMNNPNNTRDDSYSVFILLTLNKEGAKPELYRLVTDGKVRDGSGEVL